MSKKRKRKGHKTPRAAKAAPPAPAQAVAEEQTAAAVPVTGADHGSTGYEEFAGSIVNDPILRTVSQPAFALIMLMTLLLFWRGHNLPGGGFVSGSMTLCALLLYRTAHREPATNFNFTKLIPIGLSISFLTGLVPYLFTGYFLKSAYGHVYTRLTGEFEWATAMLFDTGVFLLVIGGGMTIARELMNIDPQEKVERQLRPEESSDPRLPEGGDFTWKR